MKGQFYICNGYNINVLKYYKHVVYIYRGVRDDIEQEDVEEAYYRYMEENPMAGVLADEAEDLNVEYDNEGNIIYVEKNKVSHEISPRFFSHHVLSF